jgi:FtsP/CotA-like multicopper oxidase with cupredoxin domain
MGNVRSVRILPALIAGSMSALLVTTACTDSDRGAPPAAVPMQTAGAVGQPADWDDELALTAAADLNPDPNVTEIELEARIEELELVPGTRTPAWTYNGSLPGPLIRAKVGDTIIVRFKNSLPEATSIHWHGLRVPNAMDGVPGLTQPPIEPGAEFRYEFVARDAGTYWYHPHLNSAAQVGWGLYGPLVIEDPTDPEVFGDEIVLVLSDMSLDEAGRFLPHDHGGEFGDLFGREGRVLLVNGKVRPHLKVRSGKQQRWRVINAARARYFSIQLRGHTLIKLGGDNGLAERSRATNRIVLVPGERADLVFTPSDEPGTARTLEWIPTERGFGSVYNRPREDLIYVDTVADAAVTPEPIPEFLRPIERIDVANAKELTLDLTIDSEKQRDGTKVVMGINGIPYWNSKPIEARIGETQIWMIKNDTAFSHPFHLHGYFFQVLDDTRIAEWKDTVDVPSRSSLALAVRFDDRPGVWMYHCHILDHAESGMMGHLWVAAEGEQAHPPHVELIH